MTHVFQEPGRSGGRINKGGKRLLQSADWEELPTRERMRSRSNSRERSHNYSPLRRFLISRVGQRWDDVYSEISSTVKIGGLPQRETLDAIEWLVATDIALVDDVPCSTRWGKPTPLTSSSYPVWLHPQTGILMRSPQTPKRRYKRKTEFEQVPLGALQKLVKIDGLWFVVNFADVPAQPADPTKPEMDVVLKIAAVRTGYPHSLFVFRREWGADIYAVSKRQASKREFQRLLTAQ